MKVHLQVIEGPDRGRVFTFDVRDRFLIGRASTAHFQILQDPFFSRHHAMLEINPPNVMIQDLKSTNGTRVNNTPITAPTVLRHGDTISGGNSRIQLAIEEQAIAPTEMASNVQVAPGLPPPPRGPG